MKKCLAIVLTVVVVLTIFVGCDSNSATSTTTTTTAPTTFIPKQMKIIADVAIKEIMNDNASAEGKYKFMTSEIHHWKLDGYKLDYIGDDSKLYSAVLNGVTNSIYSVEGDVEKYSLTFTTTMSGITQDAYKAYLEGQTYTLYSEGDSFDIYKGSSVTADQKLKTDSSEYKSLMAFMEESGMSEVYGDQSFASWFMVGTGIETYAITDSTQLGVNSELNKLGKVKKATLEITYSNEDSLKSLSDVDRETSLYIEFDNTSSSRKTFSYKYNTRNNYVELNGVKYLYKEY